MQVEFKRGLFSITAENKEENEMLFRLVNEGQSKGKKEARKEETIEKIKKAHRNRVAKKCPVDGCDKMQKNMGIHLMQRHGIQSDGTVRDTFIHNVSGEMPVTAPVVKLPNGEYKLRKSGGLLS